MSYSDFLAAKRKAVLDHGHDVAPSELHPSLFPFQRDVTAWAIRKGRAAIFADTGLGKTRMQLVWAQASRQRTLILAPLAVTHQTINEAAKLGIEVTYAHDQSEATGPITITNYERLDRFDSSSFGAVVLDESSILKAFSGTIKKALVSTFKDTPWRLCCTATPAPNDIEELCNHADFLGVMSPAEMRSTFFIADQRGQFMKYRLKKHAHEPFFRWLASWAMALKRPSDLGYPDGDFELPPLHIESHFIESNYRPADRLFVTEIRGITEASEIRRATTADRVAQAAALANSDDQAWLMWAGTNEESAQLCKAIPGAVEVKGSDSADYKAEKLLGFARGEFRVLSTKASLAGFGMNFQRCSHMAFVGLGYSFEQYYQAIRRCYRFGQARPVHAHIVLSDIERPIFDAVLEKERQATALSTGLISEAVSYERAELFAGTSRGDSFDPQRGLTLPDFLRSA